METQDNTDDLFNYDAGLDDIHKEIAENTRKEDDENNAPSKTKDVLGIDEEIKVTKKRAPIAKLDEARLLTQAGIPKLRKNARSKLKFKGKGHEFSDAARLLNFYQLWLDDLYPRAKFADGMSMIEKLGHSKRIQIMRREWIDEGKPRSSYDDRSPSPRMSPSRPAAPEVNGGDKERGDNLFDMMQLDSNPLNDSNDNDKNNDDTRPSVPSIFGGGGTAGVTKRIETSSLPIDEDLFVADDENPMSELNIGNTGGNAPDAEEDDLEALLAQEEDRIKNFSRSVPEKEKVPVPTQPSKDDSFDEDWSAMDEYGV